MANHKSAAKRTRQNIRKQARNRSWIRQVKTYEGNLSDLLKNSKNKDTESLTKALRVFTSKIDRAAKRGALSKQRASRRISVMSKRVHIALN